MRCSAFATSGTWPFSSDPIYYFSHLVAMQLCGVQPIVLPSDAAGQPDVEALRDAFSSRPGSIRLVVLCSPSNPSGVVCEEAVGRRVQAEAATHGAWLLTDEAYEDFVYDGHRHVSMAAPLKCGATMRTSDGGGAGRAAGGSAAMGSDGDALGSSDHTTRASSHPADGVVNRFASSNHLEDGAMLCLTTTLNCTGAAIPTSSPPILHCPVRLEKHPADAPLARRSASSPSLRVMGWRAGGWAT